MYYLIKSLPVAEEPHCGVRGGDETIWNSVGIDKSSTTVVKLLLDKEAM